MSIKHSIASKARWAKRTSVENSNLARISAQKRWQNATIEERKKQGEMLAMARKNRKNTLVHI